MVQLTFDHILWWLTYIVASGGQIAAAGGLRQPLHAQDPGHAAPVHYSYLPMVEGPLQGTLESEAPLTGICC